MKEEILTSVTLRQKLREEEQPQRSEQQEWTPDKIKKIRQKATEKGNNPQDGDLAVSDAINAALTAERQRREQAERVAQVCYDLHSALGVKWGDDPYAAISKLKDTALSALAEIEKHNAYYKHWSPHKIKGQIHPTTIQVDLSLLHEHDEKVREKERKYWQNIAAANDCDSLTDAFVELTKAREVRKLLVERLQESNGVLKIWLNFSDEVKRIHAKTLCEVIDKNTDALAKVKQ